MTADGRFPGRAAGRPANRPPWWAFVLGLSFFAYFGLLAYCDVVRPENFGFEVQFVEGRMSILRVTPGSPASAAGLHPGDAVVAAGVTPIHTLIDWTAVESYIEFDQPITLMVARGGHQSSTSVRLRRQSWRFFGTRAGVVLLFALSVQLTSLALGWFIVARKPGDPTALLGALLLGSIGVFTIVPPARMAAVWNSVPVSLSLLFWIPFLASTSIGAILLTFFASFPRRLIRTTKGWALVWLPMAISTIPAALQWETVLHRPAVPLVLPWHSVYQTVITAGYLAAALVALVVGYRHLADSNERRRSKVLIVGTVVALAPGFGLVAAYWLRSTQDQTASIFASDWTLVGLLALLCFPVSFTYAIVRHRLLEIPIIIRRGVQYALARRVLVSLAPALVAVLVFDIMRQPGASLASVARSSGWAYVIVAIGIALAHANRQRWLDSLDRHFFREQYDAQRILTSVADDVRTGGSVEAVAARVAARVDAALHPTFVALLMRDPDELVYRVASAVPAGLELPQVRADGKLVSLLRVLGKPMNFSAVGKGWLTGQLPEEETAALGASGIELILPVNAARARREAALVLGLKRSEEPYTGEDCDLLGLIGGQLELLLAQAPASKPEPADDCFEECPVCGTCFDSGAATCPRDQSALEVIPGLRTLASRYHLEKRLGQGGLGTVYVATDTALDRSVAVKTIRHDVGDRTGLTQRFHLEARLAASFVHPNVVTVHDFGVSDGQAFLVMERLEGITLRDMLSRDLRPSAEDALVVLRGVCLAIIAAHAKGIVHRDLKPENIFLVQGDPGVGVKVLDFGIARLLAPAPDSRNTSAGVVLGTLAYMAPEVLRGEDATPASDLWALAVIAHELMTGRHPFAFHGNDIPGAETPDSGTSLPPAARQFFRRALAFDPTSRYASAGEFLAALRSLSLATTHDE